MDWLSTEAHPRLRGFAVIVCLLLAAFAGSFALGDPLDIDEREHVRRITQQVAATVSADLNTHVRGRIRAEVRLGAQLALHPPLSPEASALASRVLLDREPEDISLQWIDSTYKVRWAAQRDGEHDAAMYSLADDPEATRLLRAAANRIDGGPVISRAFRRPDGRIAARIAVPIGTGETLAGFLLVAVDVKKALQELLIDPHDWGYSIAVLEGDKEIFRTAGATAANERAWAQEARLQLPGTEWRIRVWPEGDVIALMRSRLPELAMALGALLGCLLVISIYGLHSARVSSAQLRRAHDALEERVRERTIELQRANTHLGAEVAERIRTEHLLRALSGRLLKIQDDERRRIARELHDSMGQTLSALSNNLTSAALMASEDNEALGTLLSESSGLIDGVMQEVRTLSYLLHPPLLDDLGLEYVLPWYAAGFSKRSGIGVALQIAPDVGRLPSDIELTLFRITQEALSNVHRHSGGHTVTIAVSRTADAVSLTIKDDGHGVPADIEEPRAISNLGVGIAGMRERVRQFGGRLEIRGDVTGTTIMVDLPLVSDQEGTTDLTADCA